MTTPRMVTAINHVVSTHSGAYIIRYRPYVDGPTHRTGGPAVVRVYPNQSIDHLITAWSQHGQRHRTGGPAVATSDSNLIWIVEGHDIARVTVREGSDQ